MDKPVILGTAGHIDHGKTALVKALTHVDTDRLKEEKRRGITIELGFTSLLLPSGLRCGIIDMPGHEKFIDHMVAGASGIDLVLLVVAADEGVMPQTVEHFEICRLLGVPTGLVALTKVDLVDEEVLALAQEDVKELVQGSFLQGKPVVPFSAISGEGKEALLQELDRITVQSSARSAEGTARMPIDRVFTMKGFGTVATGTLLSGKLVLGDIVEILPSCQRAKIRGLQVYNQSVKEAVAGSRTAVNLQGIGKSIIQRGEILAEPDCFHPSYRLYVLFQYHPQSAKPLPNLFRFMVHWGTTKILGRIRLLTGSKALAPGKAELAQIHLESPVYPVYGDRFIARDFSTNQTLGGGLILDPHAVKFKEKQRDTLIPRLERLRSQNPEDRIVYFLRKQEFKGCTLRELALRSRLTLSEADEICREMSDRGEILQVDPEQNLFLTLDVFQSLLDALRERITCFHRENPYQTGMPKEALGTKLKEPVSEKLLGFVLAWLTEKGEIIQDLDRVRLASHRIRLSEKDEALCRRIHETLQAGGVMPPGIKEISEQVGKKEQDLHPLLDYMAHQGEITKVTENLYFLSSVLEDLKNRLLKYLLQNGEIQPGEFKSLSQTTRKYTIPLLEYFDRVRLTLRLGDRRVLREKVS